METEEKVDALVRDKLRITTGELYVSIGTGRPAGVAIIREIDYRKVCGMLASKMLTIEHKTSQRKHLCRTSPVK
jgi:hypothetical protein